MSITLLLILILIIVLVLPMYPYNRQWGYYPAGTLIFVIVIILLVLFATGRSFGQTYIVDCLKYENKTETLGLTDTAFMYGWQATLKHDPLPAPVNVPGQPKNDARLYTIEELALTTEAATYRDFKYAIFDLEGLPWYHHTTAAQYLEIVRRATPETSWSWWNIAPRADRFPDGRPAWTVNDEYYANWVNNWRYRRPAWVKLCPYAVIPCYFHEGETIEQWKALHLPRLTEAKVLYGNKPIFAVISPRIHKGQPWPFVDGQLYGQAIDILANAHVTRIVQWDEEGQGRRQTYDPSWEFVVAVRERFDHRGRYVAPSVFDPPVVVE